MWYLTAALLILCTWVGSREVFYERMVTHLERSMHTVQIDQSKIRYGDINLFDAKRMDRVGTLRSTEVYENIPAYKIIKKENVTEGSARWEMLMKEATESYKNALQSVARSFTLVLIIEEGGVKDYTTSDYTTQVIKQING